MLEDSQTLRIIDRIYQAAAEPNHWFEFADELSNAYGGAAVVVAMGLTKPPASRHHFTSGLRTDSGASLLESLLTHLPFDSAFFPSFTDGFKSLGSVFPDRVLEGTDFYREWMEPHGLAAIWPINHVMTMRGEQAPATVTIFRRLGGGEFTPGEFALGDDLVPHLARACAIYDDLSSLHRSRMELDEVIDRLRIGVILLDVGRRPVMMNRSAQMMIELGDNIRLEDGQICAVESDDELLQSTLEEAMTSDTWRAIRLGADSKTNDELQVLVNPLTAAPPESQVGDAVAILFISGPETFSGLSMRYLSSLYGLTNAEAELLARLAGGASLEEAAEQRGVALTTARSQLKRAFSKTQTHSQNDIVQLALKSISSVNEA